MNQNIEKTKPKTKWNQKKYIQMVANYKYRKYDMVITDQKLDTQN